MGLRTGLDTVMKRKFPASRNLNHWIIQTTTQRYTITHKAPLLSAL